VIDAISSPLSLMHCGRRNLPMGSPVVVMGCNKHSTTLRSRLSPSLSSRKLAVLTQWILANPIQKEHSIESSSPQGKKNRSCRADTENTKNNTCNLSSSSTHFRFRNTSRCHEKQERKTLRAEKNSVEIRPPKSASCNPSPKFLVIGFFHVGKKNRKTYFSI
jgi:hypothetical protein